MLGKKLINPGAVACTTDTTQILDGGTTQSTALYRFEDNANDTASSTGKFNKGGVFNGTNSAIDLPTGDLGIGTNDFSVSLWFNSTYITQDDQSLFWFQHYQNPIRIGGIVSSSAGSMGGDYDLRFYCMIGSTSYNANTNSDILSGNTWYHVVFVKSSTSGMAIYINGSPTPVATNTSATGAVNTNMTSGGGNTIGYYKTTSLDHYFYGKIDQFRTFNKALSTSEIATLYNENTTTANTLQVLGDTSCISTYTFEGNANDLNTSTPKNGTASNVTYDYSGTASNVTYVTGKFGKAGVFNGSSSKIDLPDNILPGNTTGSSSASVWFKSSSGNTAGDSECILDAYAYDTNKPGWGLFMEPAAGGLPDGHLYLANYSLGGTSGGTSVGYRDGNWHHAVVVLDNPNNTIKVYLDGNTTTPILSQTASAANVWPFTEKAAIGYQNASASHPRYFNGNIDQVRIFDKALSFGEINSLYNETTTTAALGTISNPSTVAYYKMADASDETGSYDGTAYGIDFNVQGKYGFAGKFSGSSGSYIQTGYTAISGTSASISLWVNINAYTSYGGFAIDSTGTGAQARFTLGQGNTAGKLWVSVGNGSTSWYDEATVSITSYGLNNWFHLVGTVNGTSVKIYINESLVHTFTSSVSYVGGGQHPYYLGGWSNSLHLNGKLDQIRFFNKEISAAEVTKLYNEVQCANTITTPESYFNTVLYSGNNNSSTGQQVAVGFKPDFTWIKHRDTAVRHLLTDSITGPSVYTGAGKTLHTNETFTSNTYGEFTSFDDNGFTVKYWNLSQYFNTTGRNYVSWNWKAASSNTTNNDGSITSTVRASQESGFSIVKYTGNNTDGATVGTGLSVSPSLVIVKDLDSSNYWCVGGGVVGDGKNLYLNDTGGKLTRDRVKSVQTNTFTLGNHSETNSTNDFIAYCFANVDGYQRIGSYVGNGSVNGPFVYTGFEPAWLIVKRTDTNGNSWAIFDNKRVESDGDQSVLFADTTSIESDYDIDFAANGFIIKTTTTNVNADGGDYIFLTIAANPDTTAPTKANSFKAKIYTGATSPHAITELGFKPDFIWTKNRDQPDSYAIVDSVRGIISPTPYIATDSTAASATSANMPTSVQADGYTITGVGGRTNTIGEDYVSWNWKGADHDRNLPSINNDGSKPSLVSANPEAGFSIVQHRSAGTFEQFGVGHGLNSAPQAIIMKNITATSDWYLLTNVIDGSGDYIEFNDVTVKVDITGSAASLFRFDSKTFTNWWSSANTIINYCFHSVDGYSRIGTYTGAVGATRVYNTDDGTSTGSGGFTPSFIIIRNIFVAGAWMIYDSARASGSLNKTLMTNYSTAEQTQSASYITAHSDGFTIHGDIGSTNSNGNTYFYTAFK